MIEIQRNENVEQYEKGENAWVPTRGSWIPIGKMKKDDYRFAQCDLFGANLIMQTGETLNPSDKLWLSPNKEFRAVYQKSDGNFVVYKENDFRASKGVTHEWPYVALPHLHSGHTPNGNRTVNQF